MSRSFITSLSFLSAGWVAFALPVHFEENRGQSAREVRFVARGPGYGVFLSDKAAVVSAADGPLVRFTWQNAQTSTPVGTRQMAAKSNYLIGPRSEDWHRGITNFESVTYRSVYPGIDLVWHGSGGEIEHDFEVAPGADPHRIQLAFSGALPRVNSDGDLTAGSIRFHKPRAYQGAREIECRYLVVRRKVRFVLGKYDRARALTIDPVLSFSTVFGGTTPDSRESGIGTAVDSAGNVYIAGVTGSTDLAVTPGAIQPTNPGGTCSVSPLRLVDVIPCTDMFITKVSGDGKTLIYQTYLGAPGNDVVARLAVDASGNVYVTGTTSTSSAFPKLRALPGQMLGASSSLVAKISSDGSTVLYATALPSVATVKGLAVDPTGSPYMTGTVGGPTGTQGVWPTVNPLQSESHGGVVFKTTDGKQWQSFRNGFDGGMPTAIAVDPSNPQVLYLGSFPNTALGFSKMFKTVDGGVHWVRIDSGLGQTDMPLSIAVDPRFSQTVYVGMAENGAAHLYKSTNGGAQWIRADQGMTGGSVATIVVDPMDSTVVYATSAGPGLYKSQNGGASWNRTGLTDNVLRFVLDPSNSAIIYATTPKGVAKSIDGGAIWSLMNNGIAHPENVWTLAMDPSRPQTLYTFSSESSGPIYSTTDGGAHWAQTSLFQTSIVPALLVDPRNHSRVWAAGEGVWISDDSGASWHSSTFPMHTATVGVVADSTGAIYTAIGGISSPKLEGFVIKLDSAGSAIAYSTFLGGMGDDIPNAITVDSAGRAYVTGATNSPDFPLSGAFQENIGGDYDAFVSVLDPSGSRLVWSTYVGEAGAERPSAIAVDSAGNVHVAGIVETGNNTDALVFKLKANGSGLIYSTRFGGSKNDEATGVAADAAGNTYVTGTTFSTDLPTVAPVQPFLAGSSDAFVETFNGQTGTASFASYLGGRSSDTGLAVAMDLQGNFYVTGATFSADFPVQSSPIAAPPAASHAFLTKFSPSEVTFGASPNPVVLAGTNVGKTTLNWAAPGRSGLQILVNGSLFAAELPGTGTIETGNWVSNGLSFALFDPVIRQTLSTLTMRTQATLIANPNPIFLSPGMLVGKTTLTWGSSAPNGVQIYVSDKLFAGGLPSSGSIETGNWVGDNASFTLKDAITGQILAFTTVRASQATGP